MQDAVLVRTIPASATRGQRVTALFNSTRVVSLAWDYSLGTPDNHRKAASEAFKKLFPSSDHELILGAWTKSVESAWLHKWPGELSLLKISDRSA